jgi:putative inorganic carbon (hco3(-)) transporter
MTVGGPYLAALGLWLLWAAVYLVPLPATAVQAVAPGVHSAYHQLYEMLPTPRGAYYLSIDRHESLQALLKYGMYAAAFFLVVVLATSRTRVKVVLYTVLASGVLQVLLALWARAMEVDLTPKELMDGHWDVLRGTFVNRNHFAAFLAMTAAAGIGLALAQVNGCRAARSERGSPEFWMLSKVPL